MDTAYYKNCTIKSEAFGDMHADVLPLENKQERLQAQIEQLRRERDRLAENERRIMALLKTNRPETIIHDLRNLINERDLLKTLLDSLN